MTDRFEYVSQVENYLLDPANNMSIEFNLRATKPCAMEAIDRHMPLSLSSLPHNGDNGVAVRNEGLPLLGTSSVHRFIDL